jgi:hypothetical protein
MGRACSTHGRDKKCIHTTFALANLKGRDHLQDLGVVGKNIRTDLTKTAWKIWTECIWIRQRPVASSCLHGSEPSGSINGGNFLTS